MPHEAGYRPYGISASSVSLHLRVIVPFSFSVLPYSHQYSNMGACMKTTIDLPDDLLRAVKIRAAQQGRTLRELVSEYIASGLATPPGQQQPQRNAVAFPIIPTAADAPLATMTRAQIVAFEHEALTEDDDDAR